jgi:hypothetical protein
LTYPPKNRSAKYRALAFAYLQWKYGQLNISSASEGNEDPVELDTNEPLVIPEVYGESPVDVCKYSFPHRCQVLDIDARIVIFDAARQGLRKTIR